MAKEFIRRKLDFKGCRDIQDFYERVMDSLDLEVGVCEADWDVIYESACKESIVELVVIKNTDDLTNELKNELPMVCEVLDKIKVYRESHGKVFVYEVFEGDMTPYEDPYTRTLDFKGCRYAINFFDRIIEALELGVGRCGRNWSAIIDFAWSESIVEKLIIKNTNDLTDELKTALPTFYKVLDIIKKDSHGFFSYEVKDD